MSTPFRLFLPRQLLAEMVAHAQAELPNECCGLLAGTIGADGIARIECRYPLENALGSPTEYESEPRSHFVAVRDMHRRAIEMLAVYHSHPTSAPVPSRKDIDRNLMGEGVMHFIVGLQGETPDIRAWWLTGDGSREAEWEVG